MRALRGGPAVLCQQALPVTHSSIFIYGATAAAAAHVWFSLCRDYKSKSRARVLHQRTTRKGKIQEQQCFMLVSPGLALHPSVILCANTHRQTERQGWTEYDTGGVLYQHEPANDPSKNLRIPLPLPADPLRIQKKLGKPFPPCLLLWTLRYARCSTHTTQTLTPSRSGGSVFDIRAPLFDRGAENEETETAKRNVFAVRPKYVTVRRTQQVQLRRACCACMGKEEALDDLMGLD